VLAGVLCGTAGFAAEYAWTQLTSPYPWTTALLAEGVPTALLGCFAGGVLGALLGTGLRGDLPVRAVRRRAALGSAAVLVALGANALVTTEPAGIRAQVALERDGHVVARVKGADPGQAHWFTAMAWQGGGRVIAPMEPLGDGRWRSSAPIPRHGTWKAALRLHSGRALVSVPLHLPRDPAIPTAGVLRPARFEAAFVPDVRVMQVERRDFVPGWLWTPSALLMLLLCAAFLVALSAGIARAVEDTTERPGVPLRARPVAA
jgi:hypothetical protein